MTAKGSLSYPSLFDVKTHLKGQMMANIFIACTRSKDDVLHHGVPSPIMKIISIGQPYMNNAKDRGISIPILLYVIPHISFAL